MNNPNGIAGLEGREPVGAVLTVGHKSPKGNPTDTDRFYLVSPREENGVRPGLPVFSWFNGAHPDKRKTIRAALVHARRGDCFEYRLQNHVGPFGKHPNRRPFCVGDGVTAMRWMDKEDPDSFKQIECPHEKCPFRQEEQRKPPACKPFSRIFFHLRWGEGTQKALASRRRPAVGTRTAVQVPDGRLEHHQESAGILRSHRPSSPRSRPRRFHAVWLAARPTAHAANEAEPAAVVPGGDDYARDRAGPVFPRATGAPERTRRTGSRGCHHGRVGAVR